MKKSNDFSIDYLEICIFIVTIAHDCLASLYDISLKWQGNLLH